MVFLHSFAFLRSLTVSPLSPRGWDHARHLSLLTLGASRPLETAWLLLFIIPVVLFPERFTDCLVTIFLCASKQLASRILTIETLQQRLTILAPLQSRKIYWYQERIFAWFTESKMVAQNATNFYISSHQIFFQILL